jgi:hypothetical protein
MSARYLQRANRTEGPFVFLTRKHKVPHLYSGADDSAPSLTRFDWMTNNGPRQSRVNSICL